MRPGTINKIKKAINLIESGSRVGEACKKANVSYGQYLKYQKQNAIVGTVRTVKKDLKLSVSDSKDLVIKNLKEENQKLSSLLVHLLGSKAK